MLVIRVIFLESPEPLWAVAVKVKVPLPYKSLYKPELPLPQNCRPLAKNPRVRNRQNFRFPNNRYRS